MRMLYKAGNSDLIWGIPCDHAVFEDDQVAAALADGWVKNPLEITADKNGDGELSVDEARAYLDSIGVSHAKMHWKKVIALAKGKLDEQNKG